jgi:UDP-N-acetylglucosamine--N-acetylmuramyl-(pentapeptide) pyrophosphoryl-undecaprenol N-acetylglucosamine transferase
VPLELAGGHQAENALELATAGATLVLEPGAATPAALQAALAALGGDRARLAAMAGAARALARPGAASTIADRAAALLAPEGRHG